MEPMTPLDDPYIGIVSKQHLNIHKRRKSVARMPEKKQLLYVSIGRANPVNLPTQQNPDSKSILNHDVTRPDLSLSRKIGSFCLLED